MKPSQRDDVLIPPCSSKISYCPRLSAVVTLSAMNLRLPFSLVLGVGLFCAPLLHAQENPLNDPDLQDALKQAKELQKGSTPAKMSDLKKQADQIAAEQGNDEAQEEQKQKA